MIDINIYENCEESNEKFLEKSFDKNDFDIQFFEPKFSLNDYENGINQKSLNYTQSKKATAVTPVSIENSKTNQSIVNEAKFRKIQEDKETKEMNKLSKELIFAIKKINKNIGRIKKEMKKTKNVIGKHNKFSDDNVIQKIKVSLQESCYKYINKEYNKFYINKNIKINQKFIQRINPEEIKKKKKDDNLLWFKLKLKDLFSTEISSKYSKFDRNYNKRQIEKLYKENKAKNVIDILEKTIEEMLYDFYNDTPIEGFETLKDDLAKRKKKMEDEEEAPDIIEEYLKKYKNNAIGLKAIFKAKKSRNIFKKNKNL